MPRFNSSFEVLVDQALAPPAVVVQVVLQNNSTAAAWLVYAEFCCGNGIPSINARRFATASFTPLGTRPAVYCVDYPGVTTTSILATRYSDTITLPADATKTLDAFLRDAHGQQVIAIPGPIKIPPGECIALETVEIVAQRTVIFHLTWTEEAP